MHLQSYLLRAGCQILWKKAEPNHQRIAVISNRGTLISLAAFVDPIHVNNEKKRWQNAPLQESNAHMERLWLLAIYPNTNFRSTVEWLNSRGGVLEDVLGLEDVLKDTFWSPWLWPWPRRSSPWPWPRGLKSSKIGLSSARGQQYFLNC